MQQVSSAHPTHDDRSVGINIIVAKHLEQQLSCKLRNAKTIVTDHMLMTSVHHLPTPPEAKNLSAGNQFWFQQYYDDKLKASEEILKERIQLFVNKPVRKVYYLVGLKGEEIDVVILLGEEARHVV
jgi:hypothetical protein